uniref:Uncharacterized protein n=1 Tax=viral metagenome TaxID=1070528 RepID=A0A6C0LCW7_9ZZZZ
MYNTDFVCSYPYYDPVLIKYCSTQLEPDFLKEYVDAYSADDLSDCLYKANFLESFCLSEYHDENVNRELNILYKLFLTNDRFTECMKKMANKYISEDLYTGFMLLFSYDYFFITHGCVCEYLKTGEIPSLSKLEEYIDAVLK